MCRAGAGSVHAVVMRDRLQQLRRVVLLHAVRGRMARSLIWPSAPRGRNGASARAVAGFAAECRTSQFALDGSLFAIAAFQFQRALARGALVMEREAQCGSVGRAAALPAPGLRPLPYRVESIPYPRDLLPQTFCTRAEPAPCVFLSTPQDSLLTLQ